MLHAYDAEMRPSLQDAGCAKAVGRDPREVLLVVRRKRSLLQRRGCCVLPWYFWFTDLVVLAGKRNDWSWKKTI